MAPILDCRKGVRTAKAGGLGYWLLVGNLWSARNVFVGGDGAAHAQNEEADLSHINHHRSEPAPRLCDSATPLVRCRAMIKRFLAIAFLLSLPVAAQAQMSSLGMTFGIAEPTADGLDYNLEDTVLELYYKVPLDKGTSLRLKYGTLESELEIGDVKDTGDLQYLDLLVAYEFDETFGNSSLFAGVGMYRQEIGDLDESDYGFAAGVNATFPVTRRFAFTSELAYHYAHFEADTGFLMLTGGIEFNF